MSALSNLIEDADRALSEIDYLGNLIMLLDSSPHDIKGGELMFFACLIVDHVKAGRDALGRAGMHVGGAA